jgi:predicted DNA-binding protein
VALERINLNVPPETRRRLRAVAKRLKKTESEVARDLLVEALRRREKEDFYRRVSEQITPELRKRLLEIARAFEGGDD